MEDGGLLSTQAAWRAASAKSSSEPDALQMRDRRSRSAAVTGGAAAMAAWTAASYEPRRGAEFGLAGRSARPDGFARGPWECPGPPARRPSVRRPRRPSVL